MCKTERVVDSMTAVRLPRKPYFSGAQVHKLMDLEPVVRKGSSIIFHRLAEQPSEFGEGGVIITTARIKNVISNGQTNEITLEDQATGRDIYTTPEEVGLKAYPDGTYSASSWIAYARKKSVISHT